MTSLRAWPGPRAPLRLEMGGVLGLKGLNEDFGNLNELNYLELGGFFHLMMGCGKLCLQC